jgi:hypothetical protein
MDEGERRGVANRALGKQKVGNEAEAANVRLRLCKADGMEMRPAGGAFGCVPKGVWVRDRLSCLVLERHRVAGCVAGRVR